MGGMSRSDIAGPRKSAAAETVPKKTIVKAVFRRLYSRFDTRVMFPSLIGLEVCEIFTNKFTVTFTFHSFRWKKFRHTFVRDGRGM